MRIRFAALAAILLTGLAGTAAAQLVGTDTTPGSSCAGFPDGATRVTADADLDGAEVTLVCDGTTWNAVEGGGGIEALSGADEPVASGPTCTQRTATTSAASITANCNAGEIMTGGGCRHSSATPAEEDNGPGSATSWYCEWSTGAATGTAYAICCAF